MSYSPNTQFLHIYNWSDYHLICNEYVLDLNTRSEQFCKSLFASESCRWSSCLMSSALLTLLRRELSSQKTCTSTLCFLVKWYVLNLIYLPVFSDILDFNIQNPLIRRSDLDCSLFRILTFILPKVNNW